MPATVRPHAYTAYTVAHDAVPGRLRLRLRPAAMAAALAEALAPAVGSVTANALTGSVLIRCADGQTRAAALRLVDDILASGMARRPRKAKPPVAKTAPASSGAAPAAGVAAWHAMSVDDVLAAKATTRDGLDPAEAAKRLDTHGPNVLETAKPRPQIEILLDQFTSLPVALLGGSAAVSAATGGVIDAAVTMGVVAINGMIGFFTEGQAEETIRALAQTTRHTAAVRRGGRVVLVGADAVVPGDVLVLGPGSFVAADARIIEAAGLAVDESALTGESLPAKKRVEPASPEAALGDRASMVWMGCAVTGGSGIGAVVATGAETEIGRIQALAGEASRPITPVERELERLGRGLVLGCLGICGAVFVLGLARGYPLLPMAKSAIALAVAAVPEGLPTVATTTLALGLRAMRRKKVAIRRLEAVEAMGAVEVLCLDKTGTITENRMSVTAIRAPGEAERRRLLEIAALCNEAGDGKDGRLEGSGTEMALLRAAASEGIDWNALRARHPVARTIYRDEDRKYMVTVHAGARPLVAVKGSPEQVVALCGSHSVDGRVVPMDDAARDAALAANAEMAGQGLRVLGVACRDGAPGRNPAADLTWLGLVGMADPVRPGMRDLIATFHGAGIRTVMITGDQSGTAAAVADELDLAGGAPLQILDSAKLENLDPDLLSALAARTHVFARVSPAHKLAIVQALQRAGRVVAMTGDGVNDGPALKAADVGIAMGASGVDVAREVANVVVEDDNLHTLADGMAQGRAIYANIRKALHFLLATNMSEILIMLAETLAGPGETETPMELLWINLVTDVAPGLALAMGAPEAGIMREPPRDPKAPLITGSDLRTIATEAGIMGASVLGAHAWARSRYGAGPQTRAVTLMSTITAQLLYAMTCRADPAKPGEAPGLFANPWLNGAVAGSFALQVLPVAVPAVRTFLGIGPLRPFDLAVAGAAGIAPFAINEAMRRWRMPRTEA